MTTAPNARDCALPNPLLNPAERLKKLEIEFVALDSRLRGLMQAENPHKGIFYAEGIHRLRQEKLQKRLEMEYCAAKIRFLQQEGMNYPQ